ncbi:MAG: GGDEF domain-containing protein [Desulfurivibrio sp.]|nr:GGDEF domain-containing protein [Desulfurivibrio sp.]
MAQASAGKPSFTAGATIATIALSTHKVSLGLLCLERQQTKPFRELDKKLLATVVEQIEITLGNARLYRLAITDPLTGLYNKRYSETAITKFLDAHADDHSRIFNVLMLDIDHFKEVNDTHGHPVGDEVLVRLAELIRHHIRRDDVACRYGGEEFILLLPGEQALAEQVAQRLCQAVAAHLFHCQGGLELRITISVGVANFPEHGQDAATVTTAADRALYEAKGCQPQPLPNGHHQHPLLPGLMLTLAGAEQVVVCNSFQLPTSPSPTWAPTRYWRSSRNSTWRTWTAK